LVRGLAPSGGLACGKIFIDLEKRWLEVGKAGASQDRFGSMVNALSCLAPCFRGFDLILRGERKAHRARKISFRLTRSVRLIIHRS
jgi:hypothetical protein